VSLLQHFRYFGMEINCPLSSPLNETNTDTHSWSWIWRQKILEKIKFFIWLMCHNSIPTLSLLHHRNITPSATCPRCGDFEETMFHCICDCRFSRTIWQHIGFTDNSFYFSSSVEEWIKEGLKENLTNLFATSLWWIWRNRNASCLNNETITLQRLASQINALAEDIKICYHQPRHVQVSDRHVRWNNSNLSCAILNIDGSCIGSPTQAGFGGLIRNGGGLYQTGFSGFIPLSSDIFHC